MMMMMMMLMMMMMIIVDVDDDFLVDDGNFITINYNNPIINHENHHQLIPIPPTKKHPHELWSQWNVEIPGPKNHGFV